MKNGCQWCVFHFVRKSHRMGKDAQLFADRKARA